MSKKLGMVLWVCICLVGCGANPPTDRELIEHFRTHRADYERVLGVLSGQPTITRVEFSNDSGSVRLTTTPDVIEVARRNALLSFHRRTSVDVISASPATGPVSSVTFANYRSGIVGSGTVKGIAFRADPNFAANASGAILSKDCLDKYTPLGGPRRDFDEIAYCKIDDRWYLYISR